MIEIVSHCYAALPHYAAALRFQLHSLATNPAPVPVVARVCYCEADLVTRAVLDEFAAHNSPAFRLIRAPLPPDLMWCRAPGRDAAFRATRADLIWAADADYSFGPGCLAAAYQHWQQLRREGAVGFHPREVAISRDHATGDRQLAGAGLTGPLPALDPADFATHYQPWAIGGLYIMDGAFARAEGYLPCTKWQRPAAGAKPMSCMRDDVHYRKSVIRAHKIAAVPALPGLRRLRHSTCGYREGVAVTAGTSPPD